MEGEIETEEDGVLVIRRIHVRYRLLVDDASMEDTARRAHDVHHGKCPVYRTVSDSIDISTELEVARAG